MLIRCCVACATVILGCATTHTHNNATCFDLASRITVRASTHSLDCGLAHVLVGSPSCNLPAKKILGMGNPLLDISAKVPDEYLAQ